MKLTLFFLLFSGVVYGQRDLTFDVVRDKTLDSIACSNIKTVITDYKNKNKKIVTLWLSKYFKITASTSFNQSTRGGHYFQDILDDKSGGVNLVDYMDILSYDIRGKFYINKQLGIVYRFYANGIQPKSKLSSLGVTYKF